MKNLYGKSKGKIHPDGVGGGGGGTSAASSAALQAALAILPAAILALAAALSPDDREVLAYLVARSLRGAAPAEEPHPQPMRWRSTKGKGNAGGQHHHHHHHHHHPNHQKQQQVKHGFECGCFDCYRGFWCRWDASPDREVIHQAIEAFEEHLASGEMAASKGGRRKGGRGRNRGKGAKGASSAAAGVEGTGGGNIGKVGKENTSEKNRNKEADADEKQSTEHQPQQLVQRDIDDAAAAAAGLVPPPYSALVDTDDTEAISAPPPAMDALVVPVVAKEQHQLEADGDDDDNDQENYCSVDDWKQPQPQPAEPCSVAAADYSLLRRRCGGWADVMGIFNSRFWSLWSPGA